MRSTTLKPRAGFLASVRNVRDGSGDRLDDVRGVLTIEATRESGDDAARALSTSRFSPAIGVLVSGRAAVVLQTSEGDHA